jgi:NTE family protein
MDTVTPARPQNAAAVKPPQQEPGQTVLVFQGGGALGAYQAGCYEAMHEAGLEPDWVIGTSIGAINAAVIAGSPPAQRLAHLRRLWQRLEYGAPVAIAADLPIFGASLATWMTTMAGLDNFFTPNPAAFFGGAQWKLGAENAGYYSTARLRKTLADLIDFDLINQRAMRLTIGVASVRSGDMHYFDNRHCGFSVEHVMASGALPPAFPAVRIDGELYWDGGILSNTPVEAVFDDNPRRDGLVFAVHVWNPNGPEPDSIAEVLSRQKDVQYASRTLTHIQRQKQLHRLRHVVAELAAHLPPEIRQRDDVRALAAYGCVTKMHVVRLLAPPVGANDSSKDIDFSPAGIRARWQAGYRETRNVIERAPWREPSDPLEGFVLHEVAPDLAITTS